MSVGWLLLSFLATHHGFLTETENQVNHIMKFHRYSTIDLNDTTIKAYLRCNLIQVLDFLKFSAALDSSYSYHICLWLDFSSRFYKKLVYASADSCNYQILEKILSTDKFELLADTDLEYYCGTTTKSEIAEPARD